MFGGHGYQPEIQDMHGIFLASGPAFKRNLMEPLRISTKDIYMIAASILKLNPAPNNGSREILSLILTDYGNADYTFTVWFSVSVAVVIFSIFNYSLYLCCTKSMSKKTNHFRMMNDDGEKIVKKLKPEHFMNSSIITLRSRKIKFLCHICQQMAKHERPRVGFTKAT
uniref:Uncharacterized protein n=1 Tax=Romanomermis culicivorax TaxID=13658 RepID=A0A915JSG2_ROMCU